MVPLGLLLAACADSTVTPSDGARRVADHAVSSYLDSTVATLADLLTFRTVAQEGLANADNPEFRRMSQYLEDKSSALGFDFEDHGAVVVVGFGDARDRLGLVTHGDVQPADATKWAQDPFSLDTTSEAGRLIGRGTEDDKGPIATALYAMKALSDRDVVLDRRVELIVSYTEESDWAPFQAFLSSNRPPALNVALDSEYPVVTAEKGFGAIFLSVPPNSRDAGGDSPVLHAFTGGVFLSQIPEDAEAHIRSPNDDLEATLREAAQQDPDVQYTFERTSDSLIVRARGVSAHSSKPWDGVNAITHLAMLLDEWDWPATQAADMVLLVNTLVGDGDEAELFGDVAYDHEFMGPLTLSLTTLAQDDENQLVAGINIRRPAGRSNRAVDRAIREAVDQWSENTGVHLGVSTTVSDPYYLRSAPHVPVLLGIFRHYAGQPDAEPIAIGGGTHARLMPNGVNFGPAMPGQPYTGHSEHEYMTREQLRLNLEMYSAMLAELAGR